MYSKVKHLKLSDKIHTVLLNIETGQVIKLTANAMQLIKYE